MSNLIWPLLVLLTAHAVKRTAGLPRHLLKRASVMPKQQAIIIRVQRPLSDPTAEWLAYDRGRCVQKVIPLAAIPAAVQAAVTAHGYYHAVLDDTGRVIFGAPARNQDF